MCYQAISPNISSRTYIMHLHIIEFSNLTFKCVRDTFPTAGWPMAMLFFNRAKKYSRTKSIKAIKQTNWLPKMQMLENGQAILLHIESNENGMFMALPGSYKLQDSPLTGA